jgi:hypothetical protein
MISSVPPGQCHLDTGYTGREAEEEDERPVGKARRTERGSVLDLHEFTWVRACVRFSAYK